MNKSRVLKIRAEKEEIDKEIDILKATTITDMWLKELAKFQHEYELYKSQRTKPVETTHVATGGKGKGTGVKEKTKK